MVTAKSPSLNKALFWWKDYQRNNYYQATFAFEMHAFVCLHGASQWKKKRKKRNYEKNRNQNEMVNEIQGPHRRHVFVAPKRDARNQHLSGSIKTAYTSLQHQGHSCHMLIYDDRQCHQVFNPQKTLGAHRMRRESTQHRVVWFYSMCKCSGVVSVRVICACAISYISFWGGRSHFIPSRRLSYITVMQRQANYVRFWIGRERKEWLDGEVREPEETETKLEKYI